MNAMDEQLLLKCRLCGIHESKTLIMIDIFTPENIVPKIHKIIPISINEYDPLPKRICYNCYYKLDDFSTFRENCVKIQDILKRELSWFCEKKSKVEKSPSVSPLPQPEAKRLKNSESKNVSVSVINHTSKAKTLSGSNMVTNNRFSAGSPTVVSAPTTTVNTTPPSTVPVSSSTTTAAPLLNAASAPVVSNNNVAEVHQKEDVTVDSSRNETFEKREKITLKLKKDMNVGDTWSVPSSASAKYRRHSSHDSTKQKQHPPEHESVNNEENYTAVNLNGKRIKDINEGLHKTNNTVLKKIDISQPPNKQPNVIDNSNINNNKKNRDIPDYLLVTNIPMAGNVYTCVHCEQTFTTKTTACNHRCEKLNKLSSDNDKIHSVNHDATKVQQVDSSGSPIYICEVCQQVFSRHASMIAHQSVHHIGNYADHDSDSNGEYDENVIFFGQKRKKPKPVRKVIQDQEGNYL